MEPDVFFLSSLGRDVALDFLFASVAANRADVVTIGPEFSTPEVLFDLGHSGEDFSSSNALDGPYDLCGTVGRYRLDEEVHVIFVGSDFEEYHIIPISNLHADRFEDFIDFREKDRSSVLCRTDEMVKQDRYIMASVNMFTHASEYITRTALQAAGNVPEGIQYHRPLLFVFTVCLIDSHGLTPVALGTAISQLLGIHPQAYAVGLPSVARYAGANSPAILANSQALRQPEASAICNQLFIKLSL